RSPGEPATADPEISSVFTPVMAGTGKVLVPAKLKLTSVGLNVVVGVSAIRKLWLPPAGMHAGVFGAPVSAFVSGSVVWYENVAGIDVWGEMPTALAGPLPPLLIVADAVAV